MKSLLSISLVALILVTQATAGTIRGIVRAEGKPESTETGAGGKYDSRKYKFAERINYAELRDFVVYLDGPVAGAASASNTTVRVETNKRVNQKGATFSPHVLPVVAGTTVEWPNNDDIFHNVFSMSEAEPFDLGLYKSPDLKKVTFDRGGRVDVFCSIHANMNCVVLVLENPFFAVADEAGRYAITNVPLGTYKLKAWHERLPSQTQEITIAADDEVKINFTLGISNLPKY